MIPRYALLPLAGVLLAGCFPESENQSNTEDNSNTDQTTTQLNEQILDISRLGVIATASSDYQTSDIAVFGTDAEYNLTVIEGGFATTELTDIGISTFGNELYREGRYQSDNLTKYSLSSDLTPDLDWQYSVLDEGDSSANPYSLTFKSSGQAYMTRYDSADLWIIDPSVSSSGLADFRLGEIDLSAYATGSGGVPRMNNALLVDDKLYVLMERLDSDYNAFEQSYLAVINTDTYTEIDTEIDTTPGDTDDLNGIELPVRNASNLSYHDGTIYISGRGHTSYGASDAAKYSGGIATVSTTDYTTALLIDDGDGTAHQYGQFQRVEVVNADHGYFVGREGWGNDTLYHFSPSNPDSITAVSGLSGINISAIEAIALSDPEARYTSLLYVGVQAGSADETGRIKVVNVLDQTILASFNLSFNPTDIEFMDR